MYPTEIIEGIVKSSLKAEATVFDLLVEGGLQVAKQASGTRKSKGHRL
jgi:hypothetical protein